METKFQTSFIPRKPIPTNPGSLAPTVARKHSDGSSLFMLIGIVVFVASVLSVGGAYFWKQILTSSQKSSEADLVERRRTFDLNEIAIIKAQATKINLADQLLKNHVSVSKIFGVISALTAESVRFTSLDLLAPSGASAPIQLTLVGYGKDMQSVAFQSKVLNNLDTYRLRGIVKNAIVSEPTINHNGTVSFGFTAQIDPASFTYVKSFESAEPDTAAGNDDAGDDEQADVEDEEGTQ